MEPQQARLRVPRRPPHDGQPRILPPPRQARPPVPPVLLAPPRAQRRQLRQRGGQVRVVPPQRPPVRAEAQRADTLVQERAAHGPRVRHLEHVRDLRLEVAGQVPRVHDVARGRAGGRRRGGHQAQRVDETQAVVGGPALVLGARPADRRARRQVPRRRRADVEDQALDQHAALRRLRVRVRGPGVRGRGAHDQEALQQGPGAADHGRGAAGRAEAEAGAQARAAAGGRGAAEAQGDVERGDARGAEGQARPGRAEQRLVVDVEDEVVARRAEVGDGVARLGAQLPARAEERVGVGREARGVVLGRHAGANQREGPLGIDGLGVVSACLTHSSVSTRGIPTGTKSVSSWGSVVCLPLRSSRCSGLADCGR